MSEGSDAERGLSSRKVVDLGWKSVWSWPRMEGHHVHARDLDISEDGTFAVVSTTGGAKVNSACDTDARFEIVDEAASMTGISFDTATAPLTSGDWFVVRM